MMAVPPEEIKARMQAVETLEMEAVSDMYNRMLNTCFSKCIPVKFNEAELSKGEAVCLDRCAAKYINIHERLGARLTSMTQAEEEAAKGSPTDPSLIAAKK